jgi:hypothetical protein
MDGGKIVLEKTPETATSQPCPMKKTLDPASPQAQMASDYRQVRLSQPSLTSAEMRAQLERNRLSYAKRQQLPSDKPLSIGLKQTA